MTGEQTREDAYHDGYVAGYGAGVTAGRSQGYSDAKYRAHCAVGAAPIDEHARRLVREAVVEIVGRQT